jgi:Carboxypeptidase regulatory-like domain
MAAVKKILFVLSWLVILPASAYAQATLAGVVKDTSGAVLPGVVVEAASPALIEKTRTATTDGTGQYQIVDLRPGTYSVTFQLTGFAAVKREGVSGHGVSADVRHGVPQPDGDPQSAVRPVQRDGRFLVLCSGVE